MKTLLTGKPYVPACKTDLAATFRRIRRQQADEQRAREQAEQEAGRKVRKIGGKG